MTESFVTELIAYIQTLPWWGIILFTFLNAYVENIIPPSPSDVILVFIGTMVGVGLVGFPVVLISATLGSILGFITMFRIGRTVDRSVVESGRYRFIPVDAIHKVESWFRRWGYYVIIANRFLSGTRAVIAFLAGMSQMSFTKSSVLSGISALAWNALILYAGTLLGKNWRDVDRYFTTYSTVVFALLGLATLFALTRFLVKKNRQGMKSDPPISN